MLLPTVRNGTGQRRDWSSPEVELLLACAGTRRAPARQEDVGPPIERGIDWRRLLDLAQRHRVVPLLHLNLSRLQWQGVPDPIRDAIHADQQANAADCLRLLGELLRLLALLEREAVPAIPFKGVTLAGRAYGDVALRDAGDLDLLVRRQDVGRAVKLLEASGLEPAFPTSTPRESAFLRGLNGERRQAYLLSHCEHHLLCPQRRLNVDLHWAIALREFCLPLNADGLWRRATRIRLAGRDLPSLCDEDLLLVLCVNGAKDCWERLDRVCDVAKLLQAAPHLDWDRAIDLAQQAGALRMMRLGLWLARDLLEVELPPAAERFARPDAGTVTLAGEVGARLFGAAAPLPESRSARALFHLRLRERWRDRAQYCAAQLCPGVGDWAALPLPPRLEFLHFLIRPFRLAGRYVFRRSVP